MTTAALAPTRAPAHDQVRKLQLAVVTETYPPEVNGVASTLARFVDGLCARGHAVHLLRPRQESDATERKLPYDQTLFRGVAIPRYAHLRMGLPARRALARLWSERRPDLVHIATEGPLGWSALKAARELGIAVSSDFRTNFDAYSAHYGISWLRRPIGTYLRSFHNRAGVTMVPTVAMQKRLSALGFERLEVVARGVDTRLFDPVRRSETLRRQWGASHDTPVILHVGRLAPEKNLDVLGQAYLAIRQHRPDTRLVFVGDGPARSRLQAQFPQAIFAGMRGGNDLATHYASADLFLFPSVTETFGNVTLEAMASGLAVVAYDYAAAAEHLQHARSGLLAPMNDGAALVALAVSLAQDMPRIRAMGQLARASAEKVGWDPLVQRLEAVLLQTAASRPARRRACEIPAPLIG